LLFTVLRCLLVNGVNLAARFHHFPDTAEPALDDEGVTRLIRPRDAVLVTDPHNTFQQVTQLIFGVLHPPRTYPRGPLADMKASIARGQHIPDLLLWTPSQHIAGRGGALGGRRQGGKIQDSGHDGLDFTTHYSRRIRHRSDTPAYVAKLMI